ncbi:MAG: Holliday junction branch migration protein RuvA, partial [Alphaproteobacteria bacterium]|nr:Holliday junction branch migration protein RuvA [Alphaproteobacteria bacterium]
DSVTEDSVIIDVGGVGYVAFCSPRTLAALEVGAAAELTIETHVREDHIHLYGFSDAIERDWFRLLATVQGVGNKTALTILGAYSPAQLVHAIIAKDIAAFKAISGIGPKLAERIVTELKDKVLKMPVDGGSWMVDGEKKKDKSRTTNHEPRTTFTEDAISALVNLGYSRSEAYTAAMKAGEDGDASLDGLIKNSLKQLARK